MNRVFIILSILVLIAVAAVGGVLLLLPKPAPPAVVQQKPPAVYSSTVTVGTVGVVPLAMQTKEAVNSAFKKQLPPGNKTQVRNTVIVGAYALLSWNNDPMGGEALLKYDTARGQWIVVVSTGGAFSVAALHKEGVPQKTVLALLNGLNQ